jgi:hypothetical protein
VREESNLQAEARSYGPLGSPPAQLTDGVTGGFCPLYGAGHGRTPRYSVQSPRSIRQDSNLREPVCETGALPLSY